MTKTATRRRTQGVGSAVVKKHTFTLDLPTAVNAQQAHQEGMKHIEHAFYADYTCHGARPSTSPGMRTWSYSYMHR